MCLFFRVIAVMIRAQHIIIRNFDDSFPAFVAILCITNVSHVFEQNYISALVMSYSLISFIAPVPIICIQAAASRFICLYPLLAITSPISPIYITLLHFKLFFSLFLNNKYSALQT